LASDLGPIIEYGSALMKVLWQDKSALALLTMLLAAWLWVFWPSLSAMEAVWRGSDTYTHAYAVPLIIGWLLLTSPQQLQSAPQADWRLSLLLLPILLVWLLGYAADVAAVSQLAAVLALQLIFISWLGFKLAWQLKFPIFYLIFLLPFGEELHPLLQEITADLSVFFLQISSVPVFREGLYITTPVGHFEVAVACSGLRFLIASLAIGTLFAHLTFQSFQRQVLFLIGLVVVSVLANGLRAFVLIWIAEKSNMAYGFGDDHYVYGWLVFALVLMLMFYLGGKFSDFPPRAVEPTNAITTEHSVQKHGSQAQRPSWVAGAKQTAVTLCLFLIVGVWSQSFGLQTVPASPIATLTWPDAIEQASRRDGDWGIYFPDNQRHSLLKLPDQAQLYRAEFAHRQSTGELVGWSNQLFNPKIWTVADTKTLSLAGFDAQQLTLKNLSGQTRLLLYWYRVGDDKSTKHLEIKWAQLQAILKADPSFGQINAVLVSVDKNRDAQARLVELATRLADKESLP
jgi:exosortase A